MIGNSTVTLTLQINGMHLSNVEEYVGKLTDHIPGYCHQEIDPSPGVEIHVERVDFRATVPPRTSSPGGDTATRPAMSRKDAL